MRWLSVFGWASVLVGIILACVTFGLLAGPPAVVGFLAVIFAVGGVRLLIFDLKVQQGDEEEHVI